MNSIGAPTAQMRCVGLAAASRRTDSAVALAEGILKSAAKYASDGATPVEWAPEELNGHPCESDLFGFEVESPVHKAIGYKAIAQALGCNTRLVMVALDHFKGESAIRGFGRRSSPVVSYAVLAEFRRRFVSFAELIQRVGGDAASIYGLLTAADVKEIGDAGGWPARPRLGRYAAWFERETAEKALGLS